MTSGSHINPAVTLGVVVRDGITKKGNFLLAILMIVAEIVGAAVGVLIALLGTHNVAKGSSYNPNLAILYPPVPSFTYWQIFWMETVATFFFVSLILSVKYVNGSSEIILNAMTIGLALYGMVNLVGHVTGGCFNPAVGLVQSIF